MVTIAPYLIGTLILAFYGVEVCPFIEQLDLAEFALVLAASFAVAVTLRVWLERLVAARRASASGAEELEFPWVHFLLELATWSFAGILLTLYNRWYYGFPIAGSGLKVTIGAMALGVFAAARHALLHQAGMLARSGTASRPRRLPAGRYVSFATQLLVLFGTLAIFSAGAVLMMVSFDFRSYRLSLSQGRPFDFAEVLAEFATVTVVVLGGGSIVARQLASNLGALFSRQIGALQHVREGRYEVFVPVASNDEFGLIAEGTNEMIEGLRERERVKTLFGKYLSPEVAASILAGEAGGQLGGRQVEVTILFSDLRGFTSISEGMEPERLVAALNLYFTSQVDVIRASGGVVDKFIGDAVMAVFGLDGSRNSCNAAVEAARGMRNALSGVNAALGAQGLPVLDNGIGIHHGPVIAGNIGSPDRLEYTVIGDTVNLASRLEGLSKDLGYPVILSDAVRSRLDPAQAASLADLGLRRVKGKAEEVRVFGIS